MVFRIWGSLRCRQLLRILEAYIHSDAHGFLPGRETMQCWLQIQSSIEMALQAGAQLSGIATDLRKAFNNIGRPQWFCLAEHIGIPGRILTPWKAFLQGFTRRFQVHNNLSEPIHSDVGFAEGDPLSVMAMAALDWSLHVYMDALAPPVRTMTFVDNISLMSTNVGGLVLSFFTLQAFLTLWGLEIDVAKSYTWSTNAAMRQALSHLGIKVVTDASELGGSLTLGASRRVRIFLARGAKLTAKWTRLRVSRAPLVQKLVCLPSVFWSAALHGCLGCNFSLQHLHGLRKLAIKHLGLQRGGANPLLRLSLTTPPTADPGFYHVRTCIFDFRRVCGKCPEVQQQWRVFMASYDGRFTAGPFYKLTDLFAQLGWSFDRVPQFYDHDGCHHDLLGLSNAALDSLLFDAWLQMLTHQVRHRKTMADLTSSDVDLVHFDRDRLTPQELGQVLALQSGAFISNSQHAKYDVSKCAECSLCGVPDAPDHWFHCPRFAHLREDMPDMQNWLSSVPLCTLHHLLPLRSPAYVQMKQYLLNLEDRSSTFVSAPGQGPQHLFSDGSFIPQTPKIASVAAWSVVNSTTGLPTGYGPVPGLRQSTARAELYGVLAAARWCLHYEVEVYLWSDSLNTVRGVQALLQGHWVPTARAEDHDLWEQLAALMDDLRVGLFHICWIPSHLDLVRCQDCWEEWVATWNGVADTMAVLVNVSRSDNFAALRDELLRYQEEWLRKLRTLRVFYSRVAACEQPAEPSNLPPEPLVPVDSDADEQSLSESLAVNWQLQLQALSEETRFPAAYVVHIFEALCHLEQQPQVRFEVSFIELTLWLLIDFGLPVPVWDPMVRGWQLKDYFGILLRPTFAVILSQVKQATLAGLTTLGLSEYACKALRRETVGIKMPVDGLCVFVSGALAHRFQELVQAFCGSKGIRKAADLAKPLSRTA
eukprot:Skav210938  [mRNA]  locus=scaffold713:136269:139058:- [translate_table: standard]